MVFPKIHRKKLTVLYLSTLGFATGEHVPIELILGKDLKNSLCLNFLVYSIVERHSVLSVAPTPGRILAGQADVTFWNLGIIGV